MLVTRASPVTPVTFAEVASLEWGFALKASFEPVTRCSVGVAAVVGECAAVVDEAVGAAVDAVAELRWSVQSESKHYSSNQKPGTNKCNKNCNVNTKLRLRF